jgi:hypothetical protein
MSLVVFGNGFDPLSTQARQISRIMALAIDAEEGINPETQDLPNLVNCTMSNECFSDQNTTISSAFMQCYIFNDIQGPPCGDEFSDVVANVDVEEILKCFPGSPGGGLNGTDDDAVSFIPKGYTEDDFDRMDDSSQLDTVLCLMKAVLPPDKIEAIEDLVEII